MADTSGLLTNFVSVSTLNKLPIGTEIRQIDKAAGQVLDQTPMVMLKVSIAMLLVVMGWMLSGWVATRLNRLMTKARVEETLAAFLGSSARFALFFAVFIVGLTIVGVGGATMAALVGALGLAVGFALRGTLGNIAGGIMLMVHRPIKVQDWVENSTVSGTVKRIGLFSTEINTQEHVRVFIPNSLLWENILKNHTYNRMRMLKLEFGISYEADVREAFRVIMAALAANPLVLKNPEPVLSVESFTEHGVMCGLNVWARTEDRRTLRDTVLLDVMEALRRQGIRMAYMDKAADETSEAKEGFTATAPAPVNGKAAAGPSGKAAKGAKVGPTRKG